ncbi:Hypothetical_protein [Hexamita inflata]|uniref:Hypothetical_protein n=1 Tax=Hexamita inflata TaxID=28002 RepID=A0AA86QP16_9EUKA|nr:Hypothetical protein HINF_LOCUS47907 [Hexamita inflata]
MDENKVLREQQFQLQYEQHLAQLNLNQPVSFDSELAQINFNITNNVTDELIEQILKLQYRQNKFSILQKMMIKPSLQQIQMLLNGFQFQTDRLECLKLIKGMKGNLKIVGQALLSLDEIQEFMKMVKVFEV